MVLGNPIKKGRGRKKNIGEKKKEQMHITFLQEIHLSQQEHEKLNYSSQTLEDIKRGIVLLILNSVEFENHKRNKTQRSEIHHSKGQSGK